MLIVAYAWSKLCVCMLVCEMAQCIMYYDAECEMKKSQSETCPCIVILWGYEEKYSFCLSLMIELYCVSGNCRFIWRDDLWSWGKHGEWSLWKAAYAREMKWEGIQQFISDFCLNPQPLVAGGQISEMRFLSFVFCWMGECGGSGNF